MISATAIVLVLALMGPQGQVVAIYRDHTDPVLAVDHFAEFPSMAVCERVKAVDMPKVEKFAQSVGAAQWALECVKVDREEFLKEQAPNKLAIDVGSEPQGS